MKNDPGCLSDPFRSSWVGFYTSLCPSGQARTRTEVLSKAITNVLTVMITIRQLILVHYKNKLKHYELWQVIPKNCRERICRRLTLLFRCHGRKEDDVGRIEMYCNVIARRSWTIALPFKKFVNCSETWDVSIRPMGSKNIFIVTKASYFEWIVSKFWTSGWCDRSY